jgi:hypothetical protein
MTSHSLHTVCVRWVVSILQELRPRVFDSNHIYENKWFNTTCVCKLVRLVRFSSEVRSQQYIYAGLEMDPDNVPVFG